MPRTHITDTRVKNAISGCEKADKTVFEVLIEGDSVRLILYKRGDGETEETGEGIGPVAWGKK